LYLKIQIQIVGAITTFLPINCTWSWKICELNLVIKILSLYLY